MDKALVEAAMAAVEAMPDGGGSFEVYLVRDGYRPPSERWVAQVSGSRVPFVEATGSTPAAARAALLARLAALANGEV